ncbi:hypothetical protein KSS87_020241 [Heliosperma pusillum]|nr:hypothetical protein KSS87_020241 [Heliosperma pusillum]
MVGTEVSEKVGSENYFDQIDDLLDFQNDDVQNNGNWDCETFDIDSFPPVWFEESEFPALSSAARSNHPADRNTGRYDDILQLEWLSNFVQDSLSKPNTFPVCHAKRARSKRPRPATFNPRSAIHLTLPSYFPDSNTLKKRPGPPKKKQKIQSYGQSNRQNEHRNAYPLRKCTCWEITETPQWTTGPGGKTLCNACGIYYNSATFNPLSAIHLTPPSYFPDSHPLKKRPVQPKTKQEIQSYGQSNNQNEPPNANPHRKCTHCEITMTPQWRLGPHGPKTLCNACGVRYKSGRLFPEYRPAASPTFVPSLHSNSHRKVVQMRKSKNEDETIQPDLFKKSDRMLPEYSPDAIPTFIPSLHSNSPQNVVELKKSKNEDGIIQPTLFEKSDRLFPEYSPATSPTVVSLLHSNSHQKVVEMSSKNEDETIQPGLFQKSSSHKKSLEIGSCTSMVEVPVMVDLTYLPDLVPGSVIVLD